MRLFYSTASPYARKVRVVAFETGFADAIEVVATDVWNEAGDLRHHNPLGKVPTLTIDDGPALFDSRVICEYLDAHSTAAKVIPAGVGPAEREVQKGVHALSKNGGDLGQAVVKYGQLVEHTIVSQQFAVIGEKED